MQTKSPSLRPVVLLVLFFLLLPVAGRFLLRDRMAQRPEYRIDARQVDVSPPPEWVNADFVQETLHASGLDANGSLLDDMLPQKLSRAFAVAPWVEEVRRVEIRFPSAARIELSYREPVALVEVASQGLFPVDGNGVLLPSDYFITAPEKKREFPVIDGVVSTPLGTAGTLWGDSAVHAAAQLAKILSPALFDTEIPLGIAKIHVTKLNPPYDKQVEGQLKTHSGTEIFWGRIDPSDADNDQKLGRLRELVRLYRSLDQVPAHLQPIDLSAE